MIFASRRTRGPDPSLDRRVRVFYVGGILALAGIAFDSSILVLVAILTLGGAVLLRFVGGREGGAEAQDPEGDEIDVDPPSAVP